MTSLERSRRGAHHRPPMRALRVVRTADISPGMRRVTLGGEELRGFTDAHTGPNIKVFVPQPGQHRPVLPRLDADTGRYQWPEL